MSADSTSATAPADRVAALADDLATFHRRYEADRDNRAVFAYTYFNLTCDLAEELANPDAGFDDPEWVADLAVAFGNRYMLSMNAIDDQWDVDSSKPPEDVVPRPWGDVYRAICRDRSTVLEDLVFAMAAHITYDLPHALVAVGTDPDRLHDYHLMNDVLAEDTDAIQDAVTARYNWSLSRLDRIAGNADEIFTDYWLRIGRSMAWYNSMRLQSPLSQSEAEGSIERATHHIIRSVRTAGPAPFRWAMDLYRSTSRFARDWPEPPDDDGDAGKAVATAARW